MKLTSGLLCFLMSSVAFAEAAPEGAAMQGMSSSVLMFGGLFVLMYFMMIRPQSKKAKEHRDLISNLKQGDEVITTGGFIGKISKLGDQFIVLGLSEGVEVTIQKQAVAGDLPNGTLGSAK